MTPSWPSSSHTSPDQEAHQGSRPPEGRHSPHAFGRLLDTHVFLWMQSAPEQIGEAARAIVAAPENELFLSAASAWEIAIKHGIGRLELPEHPDRYVPDRMRRSGVDGLPIAHAHALHVARLPPLHRDPFDRMLVAQANTEQLPLITVDEAVMDYDVDTIDART